MSEYTVVGCDYGKNPENDYVTLSGKIHQALDENRRMRLKAPPPKDSTLILVEVLYYEKFIANNPHSEIEPVPEYDQYASALFLNDGAVQLCQENGITFKALKVIPTEEVPKNLGIMVRRRYLSRSG